MKKIKISGTLELDETMFAAYHEVKKSFELYKIKDGMKYSFDEYLLRCGLSALLNSFDEQLKSAKIEGHA